MRGPSFEETPPHLSEELKKKFREALKGKLATPVCRDCIKSQNFVQVIEFLIPMYSEAIERIDRASQTMEEFIEIFKELEIMEMKARMKGDDGR